MRNTDLPRCDNLSRLNRRAISAARSPGSGTSSTSTEVVSTGRPGNLINSRRRGEAEASRRVALTL
jgi:hypothetical protein